MKLLPILLFLASCSMSYEGVMTHEAGEHHSKPRVVKPLSFGVKRVDGYIVFTEQSKYNHGNSEQHDWNKLIGVSHTIRPDGNAVLLGWRYRPDIDSFDVGWYCNDAQGFRFGELDRYAAGDTCVFLIEWLYGDQVYYQAGLQDTIITYGHWQNTCYLRQPWFGGTLPPPNDISYHIKFEYR